MSELTYSIELQTEDILVEARFSEIIDNIRELEANLPEAEQEDIRHTPVMKAPGTSDQGYRYD